MEPEKSKVYPYRPELQVFVTENYTAEGAWGHTEPERKVICVRPHEHLPYEFMDPAKGKENEVLAHEIFHNISKSKEPYILAVGKNPFYRHLLSEVRLSFYRA